MSCSPARRLAIRLLREARSPEPSVEGGKALTGMFPRLSRARLVSPSTSIGARLLYSDRLVGLATTSRALISALGRRGTGRQSRLLKERENKIFSLVVRG